MPDITKPVPFEFILQTIGVILLIVAAGIWAVKNAKKRKMS